MHNLHDFRRIGWREHGNMALNRQFYAAGSTAHCAELALFRRLSRLMPPPDICSAHAADMSEAAAEAKMIAAEDESSV